MKTSKLLITSLLAAAAMSVPAWAEDVSLTNGVQTALTISSGVAGAGNTYTYTAPEEGVADNGGWLWLSSLGGTANVALGSSESNMALSGSGLVVLGYQGGNYGTTYNFDLTNTDASAFSGKFAVVNQWDNDTVAKLSGTGWSNVEYVFAGVSREQNWVTKRGYGNSSRGYDTLALQDATTLAGITGTSKGYVPTGTGVAAGIGNINLRESITVATSGTVLTLTGAGTYGFYGKVGTASARVGVSMTGTGAQTLGGTTYLDNLSVSGGELVLSGTANIAGTTTVSGGTLDISAGTTTLGGALTLSGGNVAIGTLGDETRAAVAAAGAVTISNSVGVMLSGSAKNGTFAVFSGSTLSNAGTLTLSATNSGFTQNWTTDGNVTYVTISGAANNALVWAGGTDSWTWNTSDAKWKLFGSETAFAFASGDDVKFATAGAQIAFGNTAISAGAITIAADTTFSGTTGKLSATDGITILDGASLTAQSQVWSSGGITGGIKLDGADAKLILVGNTALLGNAVSGTGTLVFNQTNTSSSLLINGANLLQGGISVEKTGLGTLSLENSYSYTGGTKLTDGVLQVKNNSALGTGTLTMSGGTLQAGANYALANAVNVTAASGINTQGNKLTLSGQITGTGTLTKQGTGTLFIKDCTTNAFHGTLIVESGVVMMGQDDNSRSDSSLTDSAHGAKIFVKNGATFTTHMGGSSATAPNTFNGDFYIASGATLGNKDGHVKLAGNIVFGATDTEGNFDSNATVIYAQYWQKAVEFAGAISGAGMVTLQNATAENGTAYYKISGSDNTFAGTYKLTGAANRLVKFQLTNETAAQNATINLSTQYASMELGAGAVRIAGLEGVSGSSVTLLSGTTASTLTVNQAFDTTFAGTIEGGIALTKTGAGTLTLSGHNTYSGATTIEGGVLVAGHANALGAGNVTVADGATLERGVASGSVAIGGTLTTEGAAILSTGALSADTAAFAVTGNVTLSEGTIFDVGALANGQVVSSAGTLTVAGSGTFTKANFLLNGGALGARTTFDISTDGNAVTISNLRQEVLELTWAGGVSDTWKANGSGWNVTTSGSAETFQTGDSVTFSGDAPVVQNVVVDGTVFVGTMTIDSGTDFAFSGQNGAVIRSSGALTKTGAGTATIDSTVDLSRIGGGIVVNGGKLVVDTASGYTGAVTADENGTFTLNVSSDTTLSNTLSGAGTFEKTGAGTLTVSSANAGLTGQFVISGGTVKLGNADSKLFGEQSNTEAGKDRYAVQVAFGGTLDMNGKNDISYRVTLSGGTLVNNGSNAIDESKRQLYGIQLTADSEIGGSKKFGLLASMYERTNLDLGTHTLTKTGDNTFLLVSTAVTGTGIIDVQNGALWLANGDQSTEVFSMDSGSTIKLNGGTIKAGNKGGNASVALGNVAIVLTDANKGTARITADTNCSFNAGGATLYLDIGALTAATLTPGEEVSLTIAGSNVISAEGFFETVLVGRYDSGNNWINDTKWAYKADSWDAAAGTLLLISVPEPSAFGLLAGAGALALAAARRRRKKA